MNPYREAFESGIFKRRESKRKNNERFKKRNKKRKESLRNKKTSDWKKRERTLLLPLLNQADLRASLNE